MDARQALLLAKTATEGALEALNAALAALPPEPAESPPAARSEAAAGPLLPVTAELVMELKRDEGLRLKAYPDPLSPRAKTGKGPGDPWTIGYGHTGLEVREGLVWTEAQAEAALVRDIQKHNAELAKALPWVCSLDPVRQRVLCNMAFNLGIKKLLGFKNTLAMVERGDYAGAAAGMLNSLWAKQVKGRATRLSDMMKTGRTA